MSLQDKNKKSSVRRNWVPLVLSVGIIGWGFFALDRLLPNRNLDSSVVERYPNVNRIQIRKSLSNETWKSHLKSWFEIFLNTESERGKTDSFIEGESLNMKKSSIPYKQEYFLYYYQADLEGLPVLTSKTLFIDSFSLKEQAFEVFQKTLYLNSQSHRDLLPLFSDNINLLSVEIKNDLLILNFDDTFEEGLSYQLLKYQLKLLLKTAKQFSDVYFIQVRQNNEILNFLEGDGIDIPSKIDENIDF